MRKSLILLSLLALAACATPRESCINSATGNLRTVDRLIVETQGNINRGFALSREQEVVTRRTTCTGTNEDGTTFRFPCEKTDTLTRSVPVAIDLNAERAKLASLLNQKATMERQSQAAIQSCIATYPE